MQHLSKASTAATSSTMISTCFDTQSDMQPDAYATAITHFHSCHKACRPILPAPPMHCDFTADMLPVPAQGSMAIWQVQCLRYVQGA